MNKNVIGLIVAIIIIIVAVAGFAVYKNSNTNINNENIANGNQEKINNTNNTKNTNIANTENTATNNTKKEDTTNLEKKILVVYYSAQNHTKLVAEKIAKNLNADTFELVPEEAYSNDDLNWSNSNSRVSKEHNDESLRDVKLKATKVDNWGNYDTVIIGYPIWWGIAAWPVNNFIKDNNFTNKTVIPFCTSASSGIGNSGKLLENLAGTGNWKDGYRFSSNASDTDIKSFTDSIKNI